MSSVSSSISIVSIRLFSSLRLLFSVVLLGMACFISGCATESHREIEQITVTSHNTSYSGPKYVLVVANFQNRSTYMQGLFSDAEDRLGNQAKTILKTHLQQTNRFTLVDRQNLADIAVEARLRGETQALKGAQYAVVGDVTEFGRRESGDKQLFGLLGAGKKQRAYAKVMLNVVNVKTSEIIYAAQGAGEYDLDTRQALGFGSTAGYDATLNGKVLDLAVREAVNHLVEGLESQQWTVSP